MTLGDPAGYSQVGYARLRGTGGGDPTAARAREQAESLTSSPRSSGRSAWTSRSRPGQAPTLATTRADLDKFTDVAANFAGDQPEPTLGAFLAYLTAGAARGVWPGDRASG